MLYVVKANDTLTKIAGKFSVPLSILLAFNKQIIDPNVLFIGQVLTIPNVDDIPANAPVSTGVTTSDLVTRARTAIGKGIRYKLGKGGMDPAKKLPDAGNLCDCSGFICWVLGLSRKSNIPFYAKHGGWIYTDSMVADVNSEAGIFEKLTSPVVGCIVVYGAGKQIGHVGLVSEVADGKMKKVIHCSSGNDKKFKDSIQETAPTVFNRPDTLWGKFTEAN